MSERYMEGFDIVVTITGRAGIGKTTAALKMLDTLIDDPNEFSVLLIEEPTEMWSETAIKRWQTIHNHRRTVLIRVMNG